MTEIKLNTKSNTKIVLIDGSKAVEEFSRKDLYMDNMSEFDLQSRLNTDKSVTVDDYINFIVKQILPWDKVYSTRLIKAINALNKKELLKQLEFPSEIYFILTNGKDESRSAYCRNMNLVILPNNKLDSDDDDSDEENKEENKNITELVSGSCWNKTVVHELFHIWSRNNLEKRGKMYEAIGYNKTPKVINLPPELMNLKMTNPDAPITTVFVTLKFYEKEQPVQSEGSSRRSEPFGSTQANELASERRVQPEGSVQWIQLVFDLFYWI